MLCLVQVLVLLVSEAHTLRISPSTNALDTAAGESVEDAADDGIPDPVSQYRDIDAIRLADPAWYDLIMQTRLTNEAPARVEQILWKSSSTNSNVTVFGRPHGPRILQFTRGVIEATVVCEESCDILPHEVQIAAECKGCPCTVVKPYENLLWYLRPPVDHVVKRYKGDHKPQNILVLGLGSGSVVNAIRTLCEVRAIRIIEVNENVIHANKLFFGLNASVVTSAEALSNDLGAQVLQDDGEHGVQVMAHKFPGTFDTVLIDCMVAGKIPPGCKSDTFYYSIRKLLSPGAYIYQWTWPRDKDTVQAGIGKHIGTSNATKGWVSAAKREGKEARTQ